MTNRQRIRPSLLLIILLTYPYTADCFGRIGLNKCNRGYQRTIATKAASEPYLTVQSSQLDTELYPEEKTVVNVFRKYGPSVAFVTSVAYLNQGKDNNRSRPPNHKSTLDNLPRGGMGLGSGSAFTVSDDGYLLTNYHVIERAYRINKNRKDIQDSVDSILTNITTFVPTWGQDIINATKSMIQYVTPLSTFDAKVYVRINSSTKFNEARIVDVVPELDMAVLKIVDNNNDTLSFTPIPFGSSSDLLVGQRLIAIGNPFGLDRTVTTGVVSALDRSVTGVAGNQIKGCIQTDAAINPGNSGGPSLDSQGRVVGINTMILSTSGSNAGIGFAIPIDSVQDKSDVIIERDRVSIPTVQRRPNKGWLGIEVVVDPSLEEVLKKKIYASNKDIGVFVSKVKPGSPASRAGMQGLTFPTSTTGVVNIGDRILDIGGRKIENKRDLEQDLKSRVEGEQLSVTVENVQGVRRVLYITLDRKLL